MILTAPTGKMIVGHVLDVAKAPLERKLQDYDKQLYLAWAPRKAKGYGVWELRRRSNTKQVVDLVPFGGATYVRLEYTENNFINHVKDFAYLNYEILNWVKDHDLWNKAVQPHNIVAQAESNLDSVEATQAEKNKEQLRYDLKQHKREWEWLKDYANKKGQSISDIAGVWGAQDKSPNRR